MKLPRKSPGNLVRVAYAADANYGPYAGISVTSVIRRFPYDGRNLHFHLLSDGIKRRDLKRVEQVTSKANAELYGV